MAKWLEQASYWHEIYCYDLEAMSLNPGRVKLEVLNPFILNRTWTKNFPYCSASRSLSELLLASLFHRGFISCFVIKKHGYLMSCQKAVTSPNST